jgi:hypothetical protein
LATPLVSAVASTPVASAAVASASATFVSLGSPAYRYRMTVPAGLVAGSPTFAVTPWDGVARIDSDGPRTDRLALTGNRLLFVYGATTELDLKAYATAGQAQKAAWHSCSTTQVAITEATFGGEPALVYSFECVGNQMLSLYAMHDGFGLVVNLLSPPSDKVAYAATFGDLVSRGPWTD